MTDLLRIALGTSAPKLPEVVSLLAPDTQGGESPLDLHPLCFCFRPDSQERAGSLRVLQGRGERWSGQPAKIRESLCGVKSVVRKA